LYAGPALDLTPHQLPVWCVVVGVDGPMTLTVDGASHQARSVLVPPRTTHQLRARGRIVSAYLDPASGRAAVSECFTGSIGEAALGHRRESELLAPPTDPIDALAWLDIAAPSGVQEMDPRIARLTSEFRDHPASKRSASALAGDVGLSESRLLHLFRAETGTSMRAYRMWTRMLQAAREVGTGSNLTTAAARTGFASPSHLADRFRQTFGLTATGLLGTGIDIQVMDD
jgi:AraC-like DNA-binding protein